MPRYSNKTPGWHSWASMRTRCNNKNRDHYQYYGGRGIKCCERWKSFANFIEDMGVKPEGTSLDRINPDGDYEPGNCRWATYLEQGRNKSKVVYAEYGGETLPVWEIAERMGVSYLKAYNRWVRPKEQYKGGDNKDKTHCWKGHEFTPENTKYTKEGWRNCKRCHALAERERRKRKKYEATQK